MHLSSKVTHMLMFACIVLDVVFVTGSQSHWDLAFLYACMFVYLFAYMLLYEDCHCWIAVRRQKSLAMTLTTYSGHEMCN